ncbi:hypothetical protein BD770DRAFT_409593 [Pilaira anomala]|nr:hypothetical protein BD770DRAFT_409593 [Pilaira anomala]
MPILVIQGAAMLKGNPWERNLANTVLAGNITPISYVDKVKLIAVWISFGFYVCTSYFRRMVLANTGDQFTRILDVDNRENFAHPSLWPRTALDGGFFLEKIGAALRWTSPLAICLYRLLCHKEILNITTVFELSNQELEAAEIQINFNLQVLVFNPNV